VLTTVGGGVFGVVSASLSDGPGGAAAAQSSATGRSETPAGRDTSDSRPGTGETPGTPGTPSTPESGPPAKSTSCKVDSGTLTCTVGEAGVKAYENRVYDPKPSQTFVAGDTIPFVCWGPGTVHAGDNKTWYWFNFEGRFGNVPAVALNLPEDPAAGLPECR
jgi:hypothetical protein